MRFQTAKLLDMCSAVMQARRIADNQDHVLRLRNVHIGAVTSCIWSIFLCSWIKFATAKRSDMGAADLQGGRLATSQESRFQAVKRKYICSVFLKSGKICKCLGIVFYSCEKFRNGQYLLVTGSIC